MTPDRSDRLFEINREAGEKYDYFMTGLAATLTAYVGQTFSPSWSSWISADVIEALAVLILIGSVVAGIRRISITNRLLRVSQAKREYTDTMEVLGRAEREPGRVLTMRGVGNLTPDQAEELLAQLKGLRSDNQDLQLKFMKQGSIAGHLRDYLLLGGFVLLLVANVAKGFS